MTIRRLAENPLDFFVIQFFESDKGHTYIIRRYNGNHGIHYNRLSGEDTTGSQNNTI